MKKLFAAAITSLFLLGMVSGYQGYTGDKDKPHALGAPSENTPGSIGQPRVPDRPSTAPDKGVSGGVGNALEALPGNASDTARNVLNTIVDTPVGQVGEALQNLFQNRERTGNGTET